MDILDKRTKGHKGYAKKLIKGSLFTLFLSFRSFVLLSELNSC